MSIFGKKYNICYVHAKELKIMSLSMPIENSLWHEGIGIFNLNKTNINKIKVPRFILTNCHFSVLFFQFLFFITKLPKFLLLIHCILVMYFFNLHHLLLLESGDIEISPGPTYSSRLNLRHWNFNGITAHNFVSIPLIEAFIKVNNIDIICLSETFLDSTILLNDGIVYINGYLMIRADHSSNTNRGGTCMLYKQYLPLFRKINICKLNECIVIKICVTNERCLLTYLGRSQYQDQEQFKSCRENLIGVLSGINNQQRTCSIPVGGFNANYQTGVKMIKITKLGNKDIDTFTTSLGYTQTIGQPTHITLHKK